MKHQRTNYQWKDADGNELTFTRFNDPPAVILAIEAPDGTSADFYVQNLTQLNEIIGTLMAIRERSSARQE